MNIQSLGSVRENKKKLVFMRLGLFITMFCMYCSNAIISYAGTNYGENAGKWVLDQLFWVAIVFVVIALIGCLSKRAYAGGVITVVVGGLVCYFIKNPTKISAIGNSLGSVFGF